MQCMRQIELHGLASKLWNSSELAVPAGVRRHGAAIQALAWYSETTAPVASKCTVSCECANTPSCPLYAGTSTWKNALTLDCALLPEKHYDTAV